MLKLFFVSCLPSDILASQFLLFQTGFLLALCTLALVYSFTLLLYYIYWYHSSFLHLNDSLQSGKLVSYDLATPYYILNMMLYDCSVMAIEHVWLILVFFQTKDNIGNGQLLIFWYFYMYEPVYSHDCVN